ncbi:hypothetical protein GCK72_009320 [Caenorhabditis remanei]|uniref:Uncharacterized protein n=1 Tax=Caenorhabditis remanei TaxID=31234 RepID=A0A6A5H2L2_CAERE|nr:hypothetical protein GCK72_009320 [Caenorhabditis remanei]KAF1761066.1 hypothetical protein GCK72_009320 [Caenorhabditis remanei]
MMWAMFKTAEEVPRGAIVISHKVIPYPSVLVEKDVTSIVLDPMTKEVLGQLCMFGRSEEIGSGCVAKHSFLASGLALVDGGPIITTTLQRLIHRLTIDRNSKKRKATTNHQLCFIAHFEPSAFISEFIVNNN